MVVKGLGGGVWAYNHGFVKLEARYEWKNKGQQPAAPRKAVLHCPNRSVRSYDARMNSTSCDEHSDQLRQNSASPRASNSELCRLTPPSLSHEPHRFQTSARQLSSSMRWYTSPHHFFRRRAEVEIRLH
ncbi:hypothetical protein CLAIMM_00559 isoform 2 [Cladophialophora immunda]|nr:hypothetical protein CLAIMM_00559 isoform 1 [Cladophialophora immunda]OQU94159.1 hypothetical protein CLAIMM_00559 isoform 2 [Cladophialophora immunda]